MLKKENIEIGLVFIQINKKLKISLGIGGLGIGDWGVGIGDWPQPPLPIPNPQSPITNPQATFQIKVKGYNNKYIII